MQLARAQLDVAGKSQGINLLSTFIDVEAGVRHDTVFDNADGHRGTRRGFELDIRLPLFDWGSAQRDALNAQALAAANRYDATVRGATSQLREGYSAYRTAYDIARHYRDEIVPLRQAMADENVLRYNGMLIGVFELLAEAREQIAQRRAGHRRAAASSGWPMPRCRRADRQADQRRRDRCDAVRAAPRRCRTDQEQP